MSESTPSSMRVIRPTWEAPAHVCVASTTRLGGVSATPYDTLNLGLHVGDDERHVRQNRDRLRTSLALPSEPRWLNQVHGSRVVAIDRATNLARLATEEADGAWSEMPGVVIAIMTADCLPIVMTDDAGSRVAGCHAGWRGLAGGVVAELLAAFPVDAELHAWLGPAIGPAAFEVGEEVRAAFVASDAEHASAFVPLGDVSRGRGESPGGGVSASRGEMLADRSLSGSREDVPGKPGHFFADIYALARRELTKDGRRVSISGGDHCTLREKRLFHSHRRDGKRSGRMATLIWLEDLAAAPMTGPGAKGGIANDGCGLVSVNSAPSIVS